MGGLLIREHHLRTLVCLCSSQRQAEVSLSWEYCVCYVVKAECGRGTVWKNCSPGVTSKSDCPPLTRALGPGPCYLFTWWCSVFPFVSPFFLGWNLHEVSDVVWFTAISLQLNQHLTYNWFSVFSNYEMNEWSYLTFGTLDSLFVK